MSDGSYAFRVTPRLASTPVVEAHQSWSSAGSSDCSPGLTHGRGSWWSNTQSELGRLTPAEYKVAHGHNRHPGGLTEPSPCAQQSQESPTGSTWRGNGLGMAAPLHL